MHKFSTLNMLIFVIGLVLAVVLIGLGIAHVVQLKQRVLADNSNSALTEQAKPVHGVTMQCRSTSLDSLCVKV